jgi:hypothetical protein
MTNEEFMSKQSEILATIVNDATEAERLGRFFRRTGGGEYAADRTLVEVPRGESCDEHHYMQACKCRVINTTIVQFCQAHQKWWNFYDGHNEETREERWATLPKDIVERFYRDREKSKKGAAQRAEYGKAWRGVVS